MLYTAAVVTSFILKLLPLKKSNVYRYLGRHYGASVMKMYYEYVKVYIKLYRTRKDLIFIRTCKKERLVPIFARIRLSNPNLKKANVIEQCAQVILQGELKYKKHLLSRTYRQSSRLFNMLSDNLPKLIINRLITIRDEIVGNYIYDIEQRHLNKLIKLRNDKLNKTKNRYVYNSLRNNFIDNQQPLVNNDDNTTSYAKIITNLSQRQLTTNEENALQHGLHHVHPSGKYDSARFVSNIEYLFTRVTNLKTDYQHYQMKDAQQKVTHKLSSMQLNAANKLRTISNLFFRKASFELDNYQHQYKEINNALRTLSNDETILITKPDKGRGVVIMNKSEYINKMEDLLADNTKFKRVDNDPTLTSEDQLIRLLSRLKKENFITEAEYKVAKPSGSRLARLYGLPKLHKENYPLRPVMSAIKTVNYGLGKMLTNRLSHLRQSPYVIKDSFDFITKLKNSKNVNKLMISFDVVSLFTNVPLAFTIDYILDQLYPTCPTNCVQLSKCKQCVECKRRIDFQTLLEIAYIKNTFYI